MTRFFSEQQDDTTRAEPEQPSKPDKEDLTQGLAEAKNDITSLKEQLAAREVELRSYQKYCDDLEKQVLDKSQKLSDAENRCLQRDEKIADLDQKLRDALDSHQNYKESIEAMAKQISFPITTKKLEQRLAELEVKNNKMPTELRYDMLTLGTPGIGHSRHIL